MKWRLVVGSGWGLCTDRVHSLANSSVSHLLAGQGYCLDNSEDLTLV